MRAHLQDAPPPAALQSMPPSLHTRGMQGGDGRSGGGAAAAAAVAPGQLPNLDTQRRCFPLVADSEEKGGRLQARHAVDGLVSGGGAVAASKSPQLLVAPALRDLADYKQYLTSLRAALSDGAARSAQQQL
jgi:hypothetical protein